MRGRRQNGLSRVQEYAENMGFLTVFTKSGDLLVKKAKRMDIGMEWFDQYERDPMQRDELERVITIIVR